MAFAYQVVFVIDTDDTDDNVVAPQNLAGALNYDCVNCLTYAMARRLIITLDRPLTPQEPAELRAMWGEMRAYAAKVEGAGRMWMRSPRSSMTGTTASRRCSPTSQASRSPRSRQPPPDPGSDRIVAAAPRHQRDRVTAVTASPTQPRQRRPLRPPHRLTHLRRRHRDRCRFRRQPPRRPTTPPRGQRLRATLLRVRRVIPPRPAAPHPTDPPPTDRPLRVHVER